MHHLVRTGRSNDTPESTETSSTAGFSSPLTRDASRNIRVLEQARDGRFDDHHALLVQLILGHLDDLDRAIADLDAGSGPSSGTCTPALAHLDTIHGVGRPSGEEILVEIGAHMSMFPDRRAPGLVGSDPSG